MAFRARSRDCFSPEGEQNLTATEFLVEVVEFRSTELQYLRSCTTDRISEHQILSFSFEERPFTLFMKDNLVVDALPQISTINIPAAVASKCKLRSFLFLTHLPLCAASSPKRKGHIFGGLSILKCCARRMILSRHERQFWRNWIVASATRGYCKIEAASSILLRAASGQHPQEVHLD